MLLAVAAALSWRTRVARAEVAPVRAGATVALRIDSCPRVDATALRRVLSLEIGDRLVAEGRADDAEGDRLAVRCDGDRAQLSIADSRGAALAERTVRVADLPDDVTTRVLALASLELLASATANGAATTTTKPTRQPTTATKAPADAVTAAVSSPWSMFAITFVRRIFLVDAGVSAWGAAASIGRKVGVRNALRIDLEGNAAHNTRMFASANAYLLSTGAFFGPRFGQGDVVAWLALGGRLGVTRFSGESSGLGDMSETVFRGWAGPALAAQLSAPLIPGSEHRALILSFESGMSLLGAVGSVSGNVVVAVRGTWITAGAGFLF